jgi:outer membrane protein OmpA-like peptidoglycan-associated protein
MSQDIKSLVTSGDRAFENGNYYGSAKYYKLALKQKSDMYEIRYKLAESYRLDNDYSNASKNYKKLVTSQNIKFPYAEFYLAKMLKASGDYLDAQYYYRNYYLKHENQPEDWFSINAKRGIISCEKAQLMMFNPESWKIIHPDTNFNSIYADFASDGINDSIWFITSILPTNTELSDFEAKIYYNSDYNNSQQNIPLDSIINKLGKNVANPFYDVEYSTLYFTVTDFTPATIYKCKFTNNHWENPIKLPPRVNSPGASCTQPCVVNLDSARYIIYSSDKPGGMGGYDIYYNQIFEDGSFSIPYNWGRKIPKKSKYSYLRDTSSHFNTKGNEITPYYNTKDSTLYFSSDWEYGMGEYDIFKMKCKIGETNMIINMGFPINSPQNDLYFRIDKHNKIASFTSNRDEALAFKHQSCCNDIFFFELPEKIIVKTPEEITHEQVVNMTKQAEQLIPITLYFHNDRPNPSSWDTITEKSYNECFTSYIQREEEYLKIFSKGLKKESAWIAQDSIENFFDNQVISEFQKLRKFMLLMEELLKDNQKITMTIKGYTSPLNTPEYNLNLAKRRISSLDNYVRKYKNGIFIPYIKSKQLRIETVPFGETQVSNNISDDPNDRRNSVYNPLAAKERKIKVIAVKFVDN